MLGAVLRGGGKSKKKIELAKEQERVLASIGKVPRQAGRSRGGGTGMKREKSVRYKAGTKGYVAFPGPHLYAIGGRAGRDDLRMVHRLDVTTDAWSASVPLSSARAALQAVKVDGRIYVVGGTKSGRTPLDLVHSFAPLSGDTEWRAEPMLPSARRFSAVAAVGTQIVVTGGAGPINAQNATANDKSLSETVTFDTHAGTGWRAAAPMPTARRHAAAASLGGRVYVVGGWCAGVGLAGESRNLEVVESYDPVSDSWRAEPPMPTPRRSLQVVAQGGRLYAIGGVDEGSQLPNVESFSPEEGRWREEPALKHKRSAFAAAAFNGQVYVAGGICGAAEHSTVEILDPQAQVPAWLPGPSLPARRWALALAAA